MSEKLKPIAVRFPLLGEWCPVNTPGHSIPSHGTDLLGQRYAYDLLQIDWRRSKRYKFYQGNTLRYLFWGVSLEKTYCWSQAIISPFAGEIVEASDGFPERNSVNFFKDLFIVIKNSLTLKFQDNSDLLPRFRKLHYHQEQKIYTVL